MTILFRYLRIYRALFVASLKADLEFRFNFVSRFATDVFWYLAQIVTYEAIFRLTPRLGDWDIHQVRIFLGIMFLVDSLYMIFLSENIDRLSDKVRKGDLDLILAKPISAQFLVSLQRANTCILGNFILALTWLFFALKNYPDLYWPHLLWIPVVLPLALIIMYSIRFLFSSMAVIFIRAESLQYVWFTVYRLSLRPDSMYPRWLRALVLTLIPMAFLSSVPTQFLFGAPLYSLLWMAGVAFVFLQLSRYFWKFALTHYSSASS